MWESIRGFPLFYTIHKHNEQEYLLYSEFIVNLQ
jgi:hypothetical protein